MMRGDLRALSDPAELAEAARTLAGLDRGGVDPEKIAVAVIAGILQTRNRRAHLVRPAGSAREA